MNNITLWAIYLVILFVILGIGALASSSILGLAIAFFIASLVAMLVILAVGWSCLPTDNRCGGAFTSLGIIAFVVFIISIILLVVAIVQYNKNKKKMLALKKEKPIHEEVKKPKPTAALTTKRASFKRKVKVEHDVDEDCQETFHEEDVEEFKMSGSKTKLETKNVAIPRRAAVAVTKRGANSGWP
jgi:hypothetical protein